MVKFALLADTAAQTNPYGSYLMIGMLVVLFAVMYFFMIRPQRKQEKEQAQMRNSLRVGDEITTIGGIIGKIVSIKDPTCLIETGRDGTKIRILKSAVKSVDVPAAVTIAPDEKPEEIAEPEIAAPEENDAGKKNKKKKK